MKTVKTAEWWRGYRAARREAGRPLKGGRHHNITIAELDARTDALARGEAPPLTRKQLKDRKRQRAARDRSLFTHGQFVAVDGEGIDVPPWSDTELAEVLPQRPRDRRTAKSRPHQYNLLGIGTRQLRGERVDMEQILCGLFDEKFEAEREHFRPIFVGFAMTYDFTQWVCHDLTREQCERLVNGKFVRWNGYRLELRLKHYFRAWKVAENGTLGPCVTVWDVWGFFQSSFVEAMETWLPRHADLPTIRAGKLVRGTKAAEAADYNAAELRALVDLMNAVRGAIADIGLKLARWDGAGALAGAMMRRHRVKPHRGAELPFAVQRASLAAFFGGRIEACQVGHAGPVWRYDLNSAFPSALAELPSFEAGRWVEGVEGLIWSENTLRRLRLVEWNFPADAPFYPFQYRALLADGRAVIFSPRAGSGWHWSAECMAAQRWQDKFGGSISIKRTLTWEPADPDARPFAFVGDYYSYRLKMRATDPGIGRVVKIGLNALWGKTCQQRGFYADAEGVLHEPSYFQPCWAGMVTAHVHARLLRAALLDPEAIIAFTTDGLLASRRLSGLPVSDRLGDWKEEQWESLTHAAGGVYWLTHPSSSRGHYVARKGLPAGAVTEGAVQTAWRKGEREMQIPVRRFVGLAAAIQSDTAWELRGRFVHFVNHLAIDGQDMKRGSVTQDQLRQLPSRMIATRSATWHSELTEPSAAHPVAWLGETDPAELDNLDD